MKDPKRKAIEAKTDKIQECFKTFYGELHSQPWGFQETHIDP